MPVLKNPRHETYVQALISGMSQRQAYITAYAILWAENAVWYNLYNAILLIKETTYEKIHFI